MHVWVNVDERFSFKSVSARKNSRDFTPLHDSVQEAQRSANAHIITNGKLIFK